MNRFEHIAVHSANRVTTITLNRPEKRNALSPEMLEELTQALDKAQGCACGVVILTGAGSAFCAGMDLDHLQTITARTPQEHRGDSERMALCCALSTTFPNR